MSKKIFDPKRCPYEQLKEHKGSAIIFVEPMRNGIHHKWQKPRIRYMHDGVCMYALIDKDGPTIFENSCFSFEYGGWGLEKKLFSKEKTLKEMKNWDLKSPREVIVYIEFH